MLLKKFVNLSFLLICLSVSALGSLVIHAKLKHMARESIIHEWNKVDVEVPKTAPEWNQESVDVAMAMYGIKTPSHVKVPVFDPNLEDRGVTIMNGWGQKLLVKVGPAAFESWALLGSTLAHEIEIHCEQSFLLIRLLDSVGFSGTLSAEREAYMHEIVNKDRFHLSEFEIDNIRNTMNYFYPDENEEGLSAK